LIFATFGVILIKKFSEKFMDIKTQCIEATTELIEKAKLKKGDILVVGCSSSEIVGSKIGTNSDPDTAKTVFDAIYSVTKKKGIYLAVQCCEHLNRAIITEKDAVPFAEPVNVVPQKKAGGSLATTAYSSFKSPIVDEKITIVPILRAGLGMVDGLVSLFPNAKIGHIGLYRDETTLEPHEYYCKLPKDTMDGQVIVVDPALATGGSAAAAITFIKERGFKNIKLLSLIAATEGVKKVADTHPDVKIFIAHYADAPLNEHGYIVTAFGDAGDRIFGTK
jgi:uracil phosphoribosyltransferase